MFDVGFSELVVIGVVALIVIGPERLPKVARTVGLLVGRLQRYVNDVKADINREMELDELRKIQTQFTDAAKEVETSVTTQINSAEQAINQSIAPVTEALDDASKAVAAPAADGICRHHCPRRRRRRRGIRCCWGKLHHHSDNACR